MAVAKWLDFFKANLPTQAELSTKEGMTAYYNRIIPLCGNISRGVLAKQFSNYRHQLNLDGMAVEQKAVPLIVSEPVIDIKDSLKKLLKPNLHFSVEELSDKVNTSPITIRTALSELIELGYNIQIEGSIVTTSTMGAKASVNVLNVSKMSTGFYRFGYLTDNHAASKYERLDVLNALYDYYEEIGIKTVLHTGNWIDGEARFNKQEIKVHGLDGQVRHFLNTYPKREGIQTKFIDGDDHEGWYLQREGIMPGKYAAMIANNEGRTDLEYMGYMEADILIPAENGQTRIRLLHPGGGSSYAVSYTAQKIVESYTSGEKPDILLVGHYHKAEYLYNRGVHIVQGGCVCDQSPFMRKKRLAAHLGGWVLEFSTDSNGAITKFKTEFIPFYDNAYYEKWEYKHH